MENCIERDNRLKIIALDLLERCKNDNLTLVEFNRTIEILRNEIAIQTKI